MPLSRNAQIVRVLAILRDLDRHGGVTLADLAQAHGTSERTVRRDLDALREAGVELVFDEDAEGRRRWRIDYRDAMRRLARLLDSEHYLALRLAMEQVGPAMAIPSVRAQLEDLAHTVEQAIGPAARARLLALDACFVSSERESWSRSPPNVLWPLVEAITEGRACRVRYRSPRPEAEPRDYRVLPLHLAVHEGAPYVAVRFLDRGGPGFLNLHRVYALDVLEPLAAPAEEVSFEHAFGAHLSGEPTSYRLRFTPEVAELIRERVWHPSQVITDLPDGGVDLVFTAAGVEGVRAWVASWHRNVRVVEPEALRVWLAEVGRGWFEAGHDAPRD
jgi:predicted DNA-binding transcriptional regulator YafY